MKLAEAAPPDVSADTGSGKRRLLHPKIRRALEDVSPTFLEFNQGSIARRQFPPGMMICRQGEYGSTAFFIEEGTADIYLQSAEHVDEAPRGLARFFARLVPASGTSPSARALARTRPIVVDAPVPLDPGRLQATLKEGDLLGEMACVNGTPRAATVKAGPQGCTVLEMKRNVLDMILRSRSYREGMAATYRDRLVRNLLTSVPLLSGLAPDLIDRLSQSVKYRRCNPGEAILRQGAPAMTGRDPNSLGMFLVRSGFVKVTVDRAGERVVPAYLGPGNAFGEIALLTGLRPDELTPPGSEPDPALAEIRRLIAAGERTATCTALDHVELVQILPEDFREIVFPKISADARHKLVDDALRRLLQARPDLDPARAQAEADPDADVLSDRPALRAEFLDQGLMGAQSVLVLDLLKCTRCDECSKACSDTHGDVSRLIREGLRFDRFLVASSCRSCRDPYCLTGCPVDAIHRRPGSDEIWIETTCIGCGQCALNCPYGNINMVPVSGTSHTPETGERKVALARRATTCDQCHSLPGHQPNCVVACPHDAAHRMDGKDLFDLVLKSTRF